MRKPISWGLRALVLMLLSVPFCHANTLQYSLTFGLAGDGGAAPTGNFTYNTATKLFESFDVNFRGLALDLLVPSGGDPDTANNPFINGAPACLGGATGGEAGFLMITGACGTKVWRASGSVGTLFFRVFSDSPEVIVDGQAAIPTDLSPILRGGAGSTSGNSVTATLVSTTEVPEPALALPLVLLLGVLARKRARRVGSAG